KFKQLNFSCFHTHSPSQLICKICGLLPLHKARFFRRDLAALAPSEAMRVFVGLAFHYIGGHCADQWRELEGVSAAAGAHYQVRPLRVTVDPEITVEGIAVEAQALKD